MPPPRAAAIGGLRAAWSAAWRLFAFYLLFALVLAAWFVPFREALTSPAAPGLPARRLAVEGGSALTLLLVTLVMTRLVDRRPIAAAGLATGGLGPQLALGLALGAAWLGLVLAAAGLAGWAARVPFTMRGPALAAGVGAAALNVLSQQLLLAGYPYAVLRERAGPAAALVVSAVLFSLLHVGGFHGAWLPAVNVFLAGTCFLAARERTGRLWLGVGIHAAWNALLGPVLGLTVSGGYVLGLGWSVLRVSGPARWTGGAFGVEGGLLTTLATLALLAALAVRPRPAAGRSG